MKKIFCLLLTFMLSFGMVGNVFAASPNIEQDKMGQIENDVKNEIEIARKEIYKQLEQQDALILMKVYEDIIYPQIEEQIRDEYKEEITPSRVSRASRTSYYAPNGGMVTYLHPISGYKPTEVAVTCFDRDDSYDYILNQYSSFTVSDIIYSVLGYIPGVGDVSSSILNIRGVADKAAMKKIKEAGGCAEIINTYSREWGTKASIVTGWSDRYYINIPSSATNVSFKRF